MTDPSDAVATAQTPTQRASESQARRGASEGG